MSRPWNSLSSYNERVFGESVYRVGVDAGFSCPNRSPDRHGGCIFCDGSGAIAVYHREEEKSLDGDDELFLVRKSSIKEQVARGVDFITRRYKAKRLALYFQAWSNTYDSVENLKSIYDYALSLAPFSSLIISTRPDLMSDEVCSLLASYITEDRDVWVELGLQSGNAKTLERINRGHDVRCFTEASERAHSYGLKLTVHMMLLPSFDRREDYLKTAALINNVKAEGVKIHNLHVMKNTILASEYLQDGEIALSSLSRHIEDVALILAHLDKNIIVERLLTESTKARLLAPKHFPDKRDILEMLEDYMNQKGWQQGSLST